MKMNFVVPNRMSHAHFLWPQNRPFLPSNNIRAHIPVSIVANHNENEDLNNELE